MATRQYTVSWEIDVEAEGVLEAAREALKMMLEQSEPDTIAHVFEVQEDGATEHYEVDFDYVYDSGVVPFYGDLSEGERDLAWVEEK